VNLRAKVINFRFSAPRFGRTIVERAGVYRVNVPCLTDGLCEREGSVALAAPQLQDARTLGDWPPCYEVKAILRLRDT
jgi:hypothetical protein